ncbi:hypothetical protein GX50_03860 [[Emmonsia] crescens]|uniref:Uncharacterized protein n=1 Tax=[Emmonsia] crescens TaxID=73230 RepID=A0A2B7ZKG0_9EURO|nr:hypothetical protein GX50_03860 [Emmonsia crescens]
MPDDVSIKVAVSQPWDTGDYLAFLLRRVYPLAELGAYPGGDGSCGFLHELILHRMIDDRGEYRWEGEHRGSDLMNHVVCKTVKYQANLLAVKGYQEA